MRTRASLSLFLAASLVFGAVAGYASQHNYLMAAAVMVMLPLILVFVLTQRFLTEGIAMTGIKA